MARRLTVQDLYEQLREHQEREDDSSEESEESEEEELEEEEEQQEQQHEQDRNDAEEGNNVEDGDGNSSSNSTTLEELEQEEFEAWWSLRELQADDEGISNGITLDSVRDGVVGRGTLGSYIGDIVSFLLWLKNNEVAWLTEYGISRLRNVVRQRVGERVRIRNRRVKLQVKALLREAELAPLVHLDAITAERFMQYVMSLRHTRNGGYLSKSAYGNKRSALFHLFRAHNKVGFPESFRLRLGNLYRGFFRELQQHRGGATAQTNQARQRGAHKEGKDAMSVGLYRALCEWFLQYGTVDGVFAYCFLVLTWNLACRSNNAAIILFNQISWASSFDCFEVFFEHTKTDQTGEDPKYPRHIYANSYDPLV